MNIIGFVLQHGATVCVIPVIVLIIFTALIIYPVRLWNGAASLLTYNTATALKAPFGYELSGGVTWSINK